VPTESLQDRYAPENACFGCGPSNPRGLQIKSVVAGDEVVATWTPEPHHQAFPGVLNGGIVGALLDCHCNWTAAWHLMRAAGADSPPCTVTAEYTIKRKAPTPTEGPLQLRARVAESKGSKAWIEGELRAGETVTATCRGLFVAVKPGHPAYGRW
jgi:acyl-coenzyme A thioesterase PaaI-like protein